MVPHFKELESFLVSTNCPKLCYKEFNPKRLPHLFENELY